MRILIRTAMVLVSLVILVLLLGPILIAVREPDAGLTLPEGVAGRIIDVGGKRVHIVEAGSGPPLLLVHGFGASTYDFEEFVLEPLAKSHRVIAVDLFGYGWSERSDEFRYGWTLWANQLAGVLDSLGIERASVLGHSMGGSVAAVFAASHPDRIDRLILADAFYPPKPGDIPLPFRVLQTRGLGELALGLIPDASAPGFSATYKQRARLWHRIHGTRYGFLVYVRDPTKPAELAAAYPLIKARTLVFHGTADTFVPYASMERSVTAIPDARIIPMKDGTHFPYRDAPNDLVRNVEWFLSEKPVMPPASESSVEELTRLRMAYAARPDFHEKCEKDRPLAEMLKQIDARQFENALALAQTWLAACPVDIDTQLVAATAFAQTKRVAESNDSMGKYFGLLQSITAPRDGRSVETAFQVISPNEVDAVLRSIDANPTARAAAGEGTEAISADTPNGPVTLYFALQPRATPGG